MENIIEITRNYKKVEIAESIIPKIKDSVQFIKKIIKENKTVYGVTTGFGNLKNVKIDANQTKQLQINIIRSHAVGVGDPLPEDITRGIILLRLNSLIRGHSGVQLKTLNTLVALLNKNVTPVIPEKGSVGASGDLAPLAHLGLVLMGEGEAFYKNKRMSGNKALKLAGIDPVELEAKEGLALINGTQVMTSVGCHVLYDSINLAKHSDLSSALSLEALKGTPVAFDERIHKLRPHEGQLKTARNMLKLLKDSEIRKSHLNCNKVQDTYSLRCIPQVHGPVKDNLQYIKNTLEVEINSVTDNPLIFADDNDILSGGNFHGQPIALVMDFLKINLTTLGNIAERRVDQLVDCSRSGLPACLVKNSGLNSGFMIVQYTAAALTAENRSLSNPASPHSIPTASNTEDHVSMGTIASRQAKAILKNTQHIIAIEILCSLQGLDLLKPLKPSKGAMIAYEVVRKKVKELNKYHKTYNLKHDIDLANLIISDEGDVKITNNNINKTHEDITKKIEKTLSKANIIINIGGSHDLSRASLKALCLHSKEKIGSINIDAHFDIKHREQITSGSPFFFALKENTKFFKGENLVEMGMHDNINSYEDYKYLIEKNATIIPLAKIRKKGVDKEVNSAFKIAGDKTKYIHFSIDVDSVSEAFAPGVSAPSSDGFTPSEIIRIAYLAGTNAKVKVFDLVEINPKFDIQNRTARLGATIIVAFLNGYMQRKIRGQKNIKFF